MNFDDSTEFNMFLNLLEIFKLNIGKLVCDIAYDDSSFLIEVQNEEVKVQDKVQKNKFIRAVYLNNMEITINTVKLLKSVLATINHTDAILTFKPTNTYNNKSLIVLNDNGHNYLKYDINSYSYDEVKTKMKTIVT